MCYELLIVVSLVEMARTLFPSYPMFKPSLKIGISIEFQVERHNGILSFQADFCTYRWDMLSWHDCLIQILVKSDH